MTTGKVRRSSLQVGLIALALLLTLILWVIIANAPGTPPARAQESPLVTPTPSRVVRIVTEIMLPETRTAVAGTIGIYGTALIQGFRRYELSIAVAGSADWRWLVTGTGFISQGELYRFDTTRLPDGFYDLRLRSIRDDGNYAEAFVQDVEIRNANPPTLTPIFNAQGTPLPTETPTLAPPTATPVPPFISFILNGPGLYAPINNNVMRGQYAIKGTANGTPKTPFERYELSITQSGYADWQQLRVSSEQYWQDTLHVLNTTTYADGLYDLRLRLVYRDGNYSEYEVRNVYIANYTAVRDLTPTPTPIAIGILRPRPNENVSGIIEVIGAANPANFAAWELAWRASGTQTWTLLLNSTEPVPAYGTLATLDLNQLPVGAYDFRLRVINRDGRALDFIVPQVRVARPSAPATPTATPFG